MMLYVDMDGVLTDFDGFFRTRFGEDISVADYHHDERVRHFIDLHLTESDASFWSDMPWLPGSAEAWSRLKALNPVILSSPHHAPACKAGKYLWCERELGRTVTVILDRNKARHSSPGDILIDDTARNAQGWLGAFILHRNWDQTFAELGGLLGLQFD